MPWPRQLSGVVCAKKGWGVGRACGPNGAPVGQGLPRRGPGLRRPRAVPLSACGIGEAGGPRVPGRIPRSPSPGSGRPEPPRRVSPGVGAVCALTGARPSHIECRPRHVSQRPDAFLLDGSFMPKRVPSGLSASRSNEMGWARGQARRRPSSRPGSRHLTAASSARRSRCISACHEPQSPTVETGARQAPDRTPRIGAQPPNVSRAVTCAVGQGTRAHTGQGQGQRLLACSRGRRSGPDGSGRRRPDAGDDPARPAPTSRPLTPTPPPRTCSRDRLARGTCGYEAGQANPHAAQSRAGVPGRPGSRHPDFGDECRCGSLPPGRAAHEQQQQAHPRGCPGQPTAAQQHFFLKGPSRSK
ncbi:hypothetical protein SRIMHP_02685 [Streptomyces rimosus subsp. rimosus]|uniref:Uncharacterized protein n=1 Tax=Streptomyces rimosus subsp. rimosus TaxID=132474 RepID=A0ABY3YT05_STRRM|nr:hypothetical protein SRIMR7_02685 [Streptomyces rimosus subsp. rimosus]UTH93020.1 hypothetical protein SRIMHP_02685 [Streptomyces rimosus subsp. rimosus]UTJ11116.1 hypothetical protein SRIMDV3_02585 [Streptomyces rimosus subsp. rimosus]